MNDTIEFKISVLGMVIPIKFSKTATDVEMSIIVMGTEKKEKFSRLTLTTEMAKFKDWLNA